MELKLLSCCYVSKDNKSLNRTFYGIETPETKPKENQAQVLIVPFMELKHSFEILVFVADKS